MPDLSGFSAFKSGAGGFWVEAMGGPFALTHVADQVVPRYHSKAAIDEIARIPLIIQGHCLFF
jgi:hypothetical protein